MRERSDVGRRLTGMSKVLVLVTVLWALAACGSSADVAGSPRRAPTDAPSTAACAAGPELSVGSADVDGDGSPDGVSYALGSGPACPASLRVEVAGRLVAVPFDRDLPLTAGDVRGIRLPGRRGDLLVVQQASVRGGSSTEVSGWTGAGLVELDLGLPAFTATDAPTSYVSGRCAGRGLEVVVTVQDTQGGWSATTTRYTVSAAHATVADRTVRHSGSADGAAATGRLFANCPA